MTHYYRRSFNFDRSVSRSLDFRKVTFCMRGLAINLRLIKTGDFDEEATEKRQGGKSRVRIICIAHLHYARIHYMPQLREIDGDDNIR